MINWQKKLADKLKINTWQIENTIELFNDDKTIPFIARYRKEKTGTLDEIQLREIADEVKFQEKLAERKEEIKSSLINQEALTEELSKKIEQAETLKVLEDIYLPYKKKQKTRADVAIEKGLKELAGFLLKTRQRDDLIIQKYINPEKGINTTTEALNGAMDIIAEEIAYHSEVRDFVRDNLYRHGIIETKKNEKVADDKGIYKNYYDNQFRIYSVPEWRILAINRAEKDKILKVKVLIDWQKLNPYLERKTDNIDVKGFSIHQLLIFGIRKYHPYFEELSNTAVDAYKRLIFPSIEREVRNELSEKAELRSIEIFQKNLRHLMLTPPLKKSRLAGIDPGFRTGCKVAYIDENSNVLGYDTIYPTPPHNKKEEAFKVLSKAYEKYNFDLISIGNGTASKETEEFIAEWLDRINQEKLKYVIVSEAGASVYSASLTAGEEFPDYDITIRGAISIARRVQDMLNELVKIPPESIGVGMYQHDISVNLLKEKLAREVESVVNYVGVDINSASEYLLQYVSGFSKKIAKNIIEHRQANGIFKSRNEIKKVKGIGEKVYELSAGFCRVPESKNPFDNTIIHPESYKIAEKLLSYFEIDSKKLIEQRSVLEEKVSRIHIRELSEQLGETEIIIKDIIDALISKRIDPRAEFPQALMKDGIRKFDELYIGMQTQGIVRNVTDFGVFVDIGVGYDGLIYRSAFTEYKPDEFYPGLIVKVELTSLDEANKKSGLKYIGN